MPPFDPLRVLPPLRRPLAGSLVYVRQQVLLLAEAAAFSERGANMWTQLAVAAHEAVENYNDYMQDEIVRDLHWREETDSAELDTISLSLRRMELELFKMRRFVARQNSGISPDGLKRIWDFHDILKRFEKRTFGDDPNMLSSLPEIATLFLSELTEGEVVDACITPFATIHCFLEKAVADTAYHTAVKLKGVRIDCRLFQGENPDFIFAALCELGLSDLLLMLPGHEDKEIEMKAKT